MTDQSAQAQLNLQLDEAAALDADLAKLITRYGYPAPRQRENSFATLMQIIVSQQVSTKAAAAIWARVADCFDGDVGAEKVLQSSDQRLRDCGLSWRKVEYSKALATQIASGQIDLAAFTAKSSEEVINTLIQIKGFGRWSAEIYAMFALARPDIFPAADLALQIALGRLKGLKQRPSEQTAREIALQWSPRQSAVSLLLWHYYGGATLGDLSTTK